MLIVKFFALGFALMGIYAAAALQIGPEQTDAHACQLLRRFFHGLPDQCISAIDDWGTAILIVFVLACFVLLLWDFKGPVRARYVQAIDWGRPRIQRVSAKVEPLHIIILGLVIAFAGAVWQLNRIPPLDPQVAASQTRVLSLQTDLTNARGERDVANKERDARPTVADLQSARNRVSELESEHAATTSSLLDKATIVSELATTKQTLETTQQQLATTRQELASRPPPVDPNAPPKRKDPYPSGPILQRAFSREQAQKMMDALGDLAEAATKSWKLDAPVVYFFLTRRPIP